MTSPHSSIENKPELLFICEEELTIPYMTYKNKDNRIYLTMQCNTLNPHVQTFNYEEYRNRNSGNHISYQSKSKCNFHPTKDSVGFCQQHKVNLCISCKQSHIDEYPNDLILPENSRNLALNLNLHCKEHQSDTLIYYCEQCNFNICTQCSTDKHKNHPTLNIKQLTDEPTILKLKEDFTSYEDNYFSGIDAAYTQAQQELKNDYDNHKSVNKELFDIIRNILFMWDMLKESYNFNLFRNVANIVTNFNASNLFNYRPGKINEFQNFGKSNLVLNIHNIKDGNLTFDTKTNNSIVCNKKEERYISRKTTVDRHEKKGRGNTKAFECVTTVQYDNSVLSLCKLNEDLYAAGVGYRGSSKIHIVDYTNNKIIRSGTGHRYCIGRGYRHKKSDHLLSLSDDSDIRIWDYSNGRCIAVLNASRYDGFFKDIVELRSGDIITVSNDKSIKYWNMNTFHCYKTIQDAHISSITSVLIINDIQCVTGGCDGFLKLWKADARSKEDISNCISTGSEIWSGLELNNSCGLVGLKTGVILVYDINGFTQVGKLQQHTKCVNIMRVLSDGSLISGGEDSKVIIWDVDTLTCQQKLETHTDGIFTGGIEMRENEIMSGSKDKTVKIWVRN